MIEVTVDTIRFSLTRHDRAILLKEVGQDRQLPIHIGRTEAESILIELQGYKHPRPLTHDLLKDCIAAMGGELKYILINDLRDDIFYAVLHIVQDGREIDVDARPSDSVALAVRAHVPIYVAEEVMEMAGVYPADRTEEDTERLSIFRDFVDALDTDATEEE